jgi:hypothetical protein
VRVHAFEEQPAAAVEVRDPQAAEGELVDPHAGRHARRDGLRARAQRELRLRRLEHGQRHAAPEQQIGVRTHARVRHDERVPGSLDHQVAQLGAEPPGDDMQPADAAVRAERLAQLPLAEPAQRILREDPER